MHFRVIDIGAVLTPGGIISWLLVGLIAGFLASLVVRGRGSGCWLDIAIGLVGSIIGSIIASALDLGQFHFWGSVFISFIGATILLAVLKLFTGGKS